MFKTLIGAPMEKIVYDCEEYYFIKGHIYDSTFCETPKNISQKVLNFYFSKINYKEFNQDEILKHLKNLKIAELYNECLNVIDFGLSKFTDSFDFYKTVFPIITSCHRALNQPQKAIDFWMKNKNIF